MDVDSVMAYIQSAQIRVGGPLSQNYYYSYQCCELLEIVFFEAARMEGMGAQLDFQLARVGGSGPIASFFKFPGPAAWRVALTQHCGSSLAWCFRPNFSKRVYSLLV